jgi:hypothetical protein
MHVLRVVLGHSHKIRIFKEIEEFVSLKSVSNYIIEEINYEIYRPSRPYWYRLLLSNTG